MLVNGSGVVERVYSAMEESAGLLDITCAGERVRPVLAAFGEVLEDAVIVFSMAAGRRAVELDFSISVPPGYGDPYAAAVSRGLIGATDHPCGALGADIAGRCPVGMFAIDGEVGEGFKKTYTFFPPGELQPVGKLADVPSMPPAVAENAGLFARYGLDRVQMTSIDYIRRTVNLYFGGLRAGCVEPEAVRSMVAEMGLPEPSVAGLEFARNSFAVYPTLSWDSARIERICFAVITTDPGIVPVRDEAEAAQFARFAENAPYAYEGKRTLVYGLTLSPGEEYYKLGSYYQISDYQRKLVKAFDALKDRT